MIKFNCSKCGKKFSAPESRAGKKGRCPNCRQLLVIPGLDDNGSYKGKGGLAANSNVSGIDSSLFDIPHKTEASKESIAQKQMPDEPFESQESVKSTVVEKKKYEGITKLPWIIDIFLYPFNLAGVIQLIILWLLIFLLCPFVMASLGLGTEYIPIVYFLPVAYSLYYFAECIRDSAAGGRRAPDPRLNPVQSDRWDYISQLLIVAGSIAVCFWPVAVYYIVTVRSDWIYWLILGCGGFFFPMVLLAMVLSDSFNALNPILISGSIFRTLLPYCGMVLLYYAGALLFIKIDSQVNRFWLLPLVPFLSKGVQLYIIIVAVGFLGRFYWRHKDKLNWEV